MTEWEKDCLHWHGRILRGQCCHWCHEWDGLPVDETVPEYDACACVIAGVDVDDGGWPLRDNPLAAIGGA